MCVELCGNVVGFFAVTETGLTEDGWDSWGYVFWGDVIWGLHCEDMF